MWDRFSGAEMERRYGLARDLMREHELSALVVFGNSGDEPGQHGQPVLALEPPRPASLLPRRPAGRGPRDRALHRPDEPRAQRAARSATSPSSSGAATRRPSAWPRAWRRSASTAGRVGLVGVNATFSMGMPYAHHAPAAREAARPRARRRDAAVRAPAADQVRGGGRVAPEGRRAHGQGDDRAGRGREAGHERRRARRARPRPRTAPRAGCRGSCSCARWRWTTRTAACPAQNPSHRRISAGDVIITEFSASYWGYTGQIQRPIFVEAEPTEEWQRMFDVALESYETIVEMLKPGDDRGRGHPRELDDRRGRVRHLRRPRARLRRRHHAARSSTAPACSGGRGTTPTRRPTAARSRRGWRSSSSRTRSPPTSAWASSSVSSRSSGPSGAESLHSVPFEPLVATTVSSPVGVALVGTGMFGGRVAAAVARTPSLALVTCFSRDDEKRQAFALEAGARRRRRSRRRSRTHASRRCCS